MTKKEKIQMERDKEGSGCRERQNIEREWNKKQKEETRQIR